ncbi:MAG: glycine--tRNA ligase [Dehalococcoidales bacterium]|nr:glycine--tRNA ligase [Dehalococcoidales bacterium]
MTEEITTKATMDKIVSLCRRRGFVFQSSEIYGGLASCWDFGPLGVELKRNLKEAWWKDMVQCRDDMVGIDTSILMHPQVWVASGHLKHFTDPLVECKVCQKRFKADELEKPVCPACGGELTEPRQFNTMFKTFMGPVEDSSSVVYLRPETAQGMFVNFSNVLTTTRKRLPFGIAQVGKSFRNEITTGNFIFRDREFEQMEIEYFVKPGTQDQWYEYWVNERYNWYQQIGIKKEHLKLHYKCKEELAHYALACCDIEYYFPMGWGELEGIASRGDYDLTQHALASGKSLEYVDEETKEHYRPYVVEPSAGVDRAVLALLCDAYDEDIADGEQRVILRFHPRMAPVKVAVLPLSKKEPLVKLAREIYDQLRPCWVTQYDDTQSIGRRYRRQDEIGTPFCVTVDFQSLEDNQVTVRERDSMVQIRIPIAELKNTLAAKLAGEPLTAGAHVWKAGEGKKE